MKNSRRVIPRRGSSHSTEYEPLTGPDMPTEMHASAILEDDYDGVPEESLIPFSWVDYTVFGFLGMAMLWAWYVCLAHPFDPLPSQSNQLIHADCELQM